MSLRSLTQFHGYTGVVATYGDLLNVAGSPNQNNYLSQGDQAYVSSETAWYVCDVATPGAAVWIAVSPPGVTVVTSSQVVPVPQGVRYVQISGRPGSGGGYHSPCHQKGEW